MTLLLLALLCADPTATVVSVHDGDTLWVQMDGQDVKLRVHGIDGPELDQPFGKESKDALREILDGKTVTIRLTGKSHRGRKIAAVYADGVDVRDEMLRRGMVWLDRRYIRSVEFSMLEIDAHESKRGLWADPNPVAPWEWRKRRTASR